MKIEILIISILLFLSVGCNVGASQNVANNTKQESKKLSEVETLTTGSYISSSGRQIKITHISKYDFPKSGLAGVMYYKTEIPVDNLKVLRKEVDEIREIFQKDAEKEKIKSIAIRAVHDENSGIVTTGKGYGFVFIQNEDGEWVYTGEEKKK